MDGRAAGQREKRSAGTSDSDTIDKTLVSLHSLRLFGEDKGAVFSATRASRRDAPDGSIRASMKRHRCIRESAYTGQYPHVQASDGHSFSLASLTPARLAPRPAAAGPSQLRHGSCSSWAAIVPAAYLIFKACRPRQTRRSRRGRPSHSQCVYSTRGAGH